MFIVVLATQQRNKTYINIQNTEKLNYNMFLQMNVVQSVKKISSFSKMEKQSMIHTTQEPCYRVVKSIDLRFGSIRTQFQDLSPCHMTQDKLFNFPKSESPLCNGTVLFRSLWGLNEQTWTVPWPPALLPMQTSKDWQGIWARKIIYACGWGSCRLFLLKHFYYIAYISNN